MQQAAWLVTLFVCAIVVLVFWFVIRNSEKRDENYEGIKKKWYQFRNVYFLVLLAVLVGAIFFTTRELPYEKPKGLAAEPINVDVNAIQFGWEFSKEDLKVNEPYAFQVTSEDVNHGFGIYDENLNLLAQTQAMPGYTNTVYFEFEKPGTYQILCLEYCGSAHHLMVKDIVVVD